MDKIQLTFFDGKVTSELSGDFILPDTYPDVKRILRVRARPISLGHFAGSGRLEFSGAVDYIVTFSSENEGSPDSLHSVHFAAEYAGAASPDEPSMLSELCEVTLSPSITACSARLQNPRKLTLKATVSTDLKFSKSTSVEPSIEGVPSREDKLERLSVERATLLERSFIADHKQISENLEPDPSQPAIDEIITCDAEIHFCEAKPQLTSGGFTVAVKGEAIVDCLYKAQTEPGDYRSFTRKLPLSFIVGADDYAEYFADCTPGTLCAIACGTLSELNAAVGENSYGERRVIELDLSFDIALRLFADRTATLTLDMYSTEKKCSCTEKRLELSSLGKALGSNFSVSESMARAELSLPEDSDASSLGIVDTQIDVKLTAVTLNRGRAQISGEAAVSCILTDRSSFTTVEFMLPVKCELSVGELSEPIGFVCDALASDIRSRIDPSRITCDFEVALNFVLLRRARYGVIDSISLSKEEIESPMTRTAMLLCYPSADESLWNIAKRYGTTCAAIRSANPEMSDKPHVIVIPAK